MKALLSLNFIWIVFVFSAKLAIFALGLLFKEIKQVTLNVRDKWVLVKWTVMPILCNFVEV